MKTLDEVIKALEICIDPKGCGNCPYADYDGAPGCFGEEREDALKHLKKYRKLLDSQKSAEMENKPACVSEMENTAAAPWNPERNRYCCDDCGDYVGKHDKFCPGCGRMLTDWTKEGRKAK